MGSFKRLQHINKLVADDYSHLTVSNSTTLIMNYIESEDLIHADFSNIHYESKFKHQMAMADQIGLLTSIDSRKNYEIVIVSISKSRTESFAQIAIGYKRTKRDGMLIIEGSKADGIDTVIHKLSGFQVLDHVIPKAHGKIAILRLSSKDVNGFSEWLTFNTPSKNEDGYYSMPGLFSYKRADPASKFLTTLFDHNLSGDVMDLGAGWGFLSSKLLNESLNLKSITLIDHDLKALECARRNITSSKAIFKWFDIEDVCQSDLKYDNIICNPPFHSAKGKNIELGKTFIKAAHGALKDAGSLLLVSNIQLPYETLVDSLFKTFSIAAQNKYFKIILAKRPK